MAETPKPTTRPNDRAPRLTSDDALDQMFGYYTREDTPRVVTELDARKAA